MRRDDYILGRHDYWTHFWFGFVFGAGLGARISWNLFDKRWESIVLTITIALALALGCGRWGDSAWEWLLTWWAGF